MSPVVAPGCHHHKSQAGSDLVALLWQHNSHGLLSSPVTPHTRASDIVSWSCGSCVVTTQEPCFICKLREANCVCVYSCNSGYFDIIIYIYIYIYIYKCSWKRVFRCWYVDFCISENEISGIMEVRLYFLNFQKVFFVISANIRGLI